MTSLDGAEDLASGLNTANIARQRGVTRAAIYRVRKNPIESWEEFTGEEMD